jgi:predicted phosphoribosyltransferase
MLNKYRDRVMAGDILAENLAGKNIQNAVVLGIPRGGVVVAARVAGKLGLPLDIIIPRKIGSPLNPEAAIGAVTQDGTILVNHYAASLHCVDEDKIQKLAEEQITEIKRRMIKYRGQAEYPDYRGKTIILVDDGIATGFTVMAAIRSIKKMFSPRKMILAVPVAPADTINNFKEEVDDVVCPLVPEDFYAVGQFYQNFDQTTDQEVIDLLYKSEDFKEQLKQEVYSLKTIALDDDLARLKTNLEKEGYRVVESSMAEQADAFVVSGLENNFMNMQDIKTQKKVIDASGKSVQEIINELRNIP